MIELKTKEHLIYLLQSGLLRISRYDLHFIQNLQNIVLRKEKITSNQVSLLEKIVEKYKRQLNKHNVTEQNLNKLYWETEIILSDPKHTEAYINIQDDLIIFRAPFNTKFVEENAKSKQKIYVWSKEKRRYEATYNTVALKILLGMATKYYTKINYCEVTKRLLNTLDRFSSAKFWSPTLVKHNNKYLLVAMNSFVAEATNHIPLDGSYSSLVELSRYAITIDSSVTNNDLSLEFASKYIVDFDLADADFLVECISMMNPVTVFFAGNAGLLPAHKKMLIEKLEKKSIQVDTNSHEIIETRLEKYKKCVLITKSYLVSNSHNAFVKVIKMTNSLPIQIT